MSTAEKLLTPGEASSVLGVSESTMAFWRKNRRKGIEPMGPKYVRVGYRTIGYSRADIQSFIDSKKEAAE